MDKILSVVIPVYNLEKIIPKTLNSLFSQSVLAKNYEVIVVDDGSKDRTREILRSFRKDRENELSILKTIKKHGRGAARNLGIENANGEVIVLLDGDIIAPGNLLAEHFKWHNKFSKKNFAMTGRITWSPEIKITNFMYWLEHGGKQVEFDNLSHGREINYEHFYTGNVSFKREFLFKNGLFDEDFGRNFYDDLELAYRLGKRGLRIFYNKNALGYHFHPTDPKIYTKRMFYIGRGARVLFNKHPELKDKVAFSRFTPRTILNQILSPLFFLIWKVFKSQRWMGYFYNAKFFRSYIKGYKKND